jgi:hypothetical protein
MPMPSMSGRDSYSSCSSLLVHRKNKVKIYKLVCDLRLDVPVVTSQMV